MDFEQFKLEISKMNLSPKEQEDLLVLVRRKLRQHGYSGEFINFDILRDPNLKLNNSELM